MSTEPSFIAGIAAWSTFAGAIVTAVSASVIAWQAILTRRSLKMTAKTVKLARKEYRRNTDLIREAERAAIDAEMPRLSVHMKPYGLDVWELPAGATDRLVTEYLNPFERVYDLRSADRDKLLMASAQAVIANDGPRRATVKIYLPRALELGVVHEVTIPPGGEHKMDIFRVETVADWARIARAWTEREDVGAFATGEVVFSMSYEFPGARGAFEHRTIESGGTVLYRTTGDQLTSDHWAAGGNVAPEAPIAFVPQPFTRRYRVVRDGEMTWMDPE